MRRRMLNAAVLLLVLITPACSRESKDMKAFIEYVGQKALGPQLALTSYGEGRVLAFETGPLDGGTGIISLNNNAAFWVLDGIVYAVNDTAKGLDPSLKMAPPEITYERVRAVAK